MQPVPDDDRGAASGTEAVAVGTQLKTPEDGGVLGGVRRLSELAATAQEPEIVYAGLARELIATLGAEEVHVHDLGEPCETVMVYVLGGDARLSYMQPRGERPPGVSWVQSTGRSFLAVGPRELDASVPRLAFTCPAPDGAMGCALLLPLGGPGRAQAVVVLVRRQLPAFSQSAIEQAATLCQQTSTALALVEARAEAGTDSVVGCMNRRAMRRRLDEEIGRAQRTGAPLSCLMIDLDDFKQINDVHGHHAGDVALRQVGQALMGEFRAFDRVARYGGDEFVVILPHAGIDSAMAAGARALGRLKAVRLPGTGTGIAASVGAAQWQEPMGVEDLLAACDAALLRRKREGKAGVSRATTGSPAAV